MPNDCPTFFTKERAEEIANAVQADDPDWTYTVEARGVNHYVVAVYNEDGRPLGYL